MMNNDIVQKLKENGITINYFRKEKVGQLHTLFDAGVDFVLTDNLEEMNHAFSKLNIR
ncbi:MAG: glycerophosphoryl diester phosphodiesterase [Arcticibacterium sp.]|jgi:glycerophosphoryl diester phosphodiesterase